MRAPHRRSVLRQGPMHAWPVNAPTGIQVAMARAQLQSRYGIPVGYGERLTLHTDGWWSPHRAPPFYIEPEAIRVTEPGAYLCGFEMWAHRDGNLSGVASVMEPYLGVVVPAVGETWTETRERFGTVITAGTGVIKNAEYVCISSSVFFTTEEPEWYLRLWPVDAWDYDPLYIVDSDPNHLWIAKLGDTPPYTV